jgi:hypothetical protein
VVGLVVTQLRSRVVLIEQRVTAAVGQVVQALGRIGTAVNAFGQSLLQSLMTALRDAVNVVHALVQRPIDAVVQFALGAIGRLWTFVSGFVKNAIQGLGGARPDVRSAIGGFILAPAPQLRDVLSSGPITRPVPPGPITIPVLRTLLFAFAVIGALVVYLFPSLLVVVAELALLVGPEIAIAVVGLVAILVLLLVLYLTIVLFRWLLRRTTRKPCGITTKTLVHAPDGSADTRRVVGVNERVELRATSRATWTTTRGTVSPAIGRTVIWTAPDPSGLSTITATPSKAAPCRVSFRVVAPDHRDLTKNTDRAYTAGLAGSGFVAGVVVAPTTVSFSRVEVMEGSVRATATGYYDTVLGWNGIVHPPTSRWLAIDARNNGIVDTVGTNPPGTPTPFSKGSFFWPIPQLYRIVGSSGRGAEYSRGNHRQDMTGTSGEETTSKEGATRSRRP